ncbi:exosome non-catalytic core subunit rrp4 [Irineochytrium annulatum]|nr:exosome non-catalytic core subunit rrp4 [Irineochytrium annulatum]
MGDAMEMDDAPRVQFFTPGETITSDPAFMRGHGTYSQDEQLIASVAGVVERVNKLISVKPMKSRYNGEIGDVVVGRIVEVGQKRWRVDICARQDAVLPLAAVNLPGGELRRRSESDELQMRSLLNEGDLISAEIQAFFGDGGASIHTRSARYGKLRNGSLVTVPSSLVKRSKSHFLTLTCGVDVILGLNGYIWVCKHVQFSQEAATQHEGLFSNENEDISDEIRLAIVRVCNCIHALTSQGCLISETLINYAYDVSLNFQPKQIHEHAKEIVEEARRLAA